MLRRTASMGPSCFALFAALGCSAAEVGPDAEPLESVEASSAALDASTVVQTSYDSSASPVHILIRSCKSTTAAGVHQVDCRVDPEYAVIGGGASPTSTNGSAKPFITESRPVDGRTWRASSDEPAALSHDLTVYVLGMRLDGVNTQVLRDSIEWKSRSTTSSSLSQSVDSDAMLLSGGAFTQPNAGVSGDRILTTNAWSSSTSWNVTSSARSGTVAGTTQLTLLQIDKKIIEGFGALEVLHRSGSALSTSGGTHSTRLDVQTGWALIGMGAAARTSSGSPRMITGITPCSTGRCVTVTSGGSSAGSTIPYLSQVRKVPGSHGVCNAGGPLRASMDSCVASVCAARSSCCSSSWDATCVSMVPSVCGKSCAKDTCVRSAYEPSKWQLPDGSPVASNCYYYAQNKLPDGRGMDPGSSLGIEESDFTAPRLAALAAGDGLIPSTWGATCGENRTKVMLSTNSSAFNYHWYRQDVSGLWSDKFATWGQALITENRGTRPYTDVQSNTYQTFFCACNPALP